MGSIPSSGIITRNFSCSYLHAGVAQLVERLLPKQEVAGSTPAVRLRHNNTLWAGNSAARVARS
jgi:hypothetical protein